MGRNEVGKEQIRSLTVMGAGRSLGLTIPIELVREYKLRPHQQVRVIARNDQLIIKLKNKGS